MRVRIAPAFVVVPQGPQAPASVYFGMTAREALNCAKYSLGPLTVVNGSLIGAIGWQTAIFPDSPELAQRVAAITDGTVLD